MAVAAESASGAHNPDFSLWEEETTERSHFFDRYQRLYYDTATWLAEALDGSMLTCFEYTTDGRELFAEDGTPLTEIFIDAYNDAKRFPAERPELAFELRRRKHELDEYKLMLQMVRGEQPNTMIVLSDFPPELMHATKDVDGYNVTRKQTMLRVLAWNGQMLKMYSKSLDLSDRTALEEVYRHFGKTPKGGELLGQRIHEDMDEERQSTLTSELMGVYDRSLAATRGGTWYAGRRDSARDTYDFVLSQYDILDYFADRFLDRTPTDDDRYNIAALMSKRYKRFNRLGVVELDVAMGGLIGADIERQLWYAGDEARIRGDTYSGCGASVAAQLNESGYGGPNGDLQDQMGSRSFTCPNGHPMWRKVANKPEMLCDVCKADVSCGLLTYDPIFSIRSGRRRKNHKAPPGRRNTNHERVRQRPKVAAVVGGQALALAA